MRYAVAYFNLGGEDNNEVVVIEAVNPVVALVFGAKHLAASNCQEIDDWFDSLLDVMPVPEDYALRIEQIRLKFADVDMRVSAPVLIL